MFVEPETVEIVRQIVMKRHRAAIPFRRMPPPAQFRHQPPGNASLRFYRQTPKQIPFLSPIFQPAE
jgi:hypothetical protein